MKDRINDLIEKYDCLYRMVIVSKNGCSEEDYIYSNFLLGQSIILDNIRTDLQEMKEQFINNN